MFRVQFQPECRRLIEEIAGSPLKFVESKQHGTLALIEDDELKSAFRATGRCGNGLAILGMKDFNTDSPSLTLRFETVEDAQSFKNWLANSGEQKFWDWDEYQVSEATGHMSFNYHDPGGDVIVASREKSELEILASEGKK